MIIHLLSGFLGSGKTTAIQQACSALQKKGLRIGVITNDQGIKLIDGFYFRKLGIPELQVGNGCFCCNYSELDNNIDALIVSHQPDIIFAESVGTCTDIVATVMKPLLHFRNLKKVTLSTIVDLRLLHMLIQKDSNIFHDDVKYIYFKQLEEAQLIVLNKADLTDQVVLNETLQFLNGQYAGKKIIIQNSLYESGIAAWLGAISGDTCDPLPRSLQINYDKYATGEAEMAFLDNEMLIRCDNGEAESAAMYLIRAFAGQVKQSGATIGHLKFWLNDKHKISFTSVESRDAINDINIAKATACSLVVNARVQTSPRQLNEHINIAIENTKEHKGITIAESSISFFSPGYPRPLHREGG